MRRNLAALLLLAGAIVAIPSFSLAANGAGPVSPGDYDRASKAALEATGGGTVQDVDRDIEAGATWEVEVIKTDGTHVDVLLDAQFRLISVGGEREPNEPSRDDDDDHDDD